MNNREEISWVNIFKGILIVLMVFGHAWSPITTYIYMFHMPAFIVISGYTYRGNQYSLGTFVRKKMKTLLMPMILINVVFIGIYSIMQKAGIYHFFQSTEAVPFLNRIGMFFKNAATADLGGATWFLLVLFVVELIYKITEFLCDKIKFHPMMKYILSVAEGLLGWYLIRNRITVPYYLDLSLFGIIFYAFGAMLKEYETLENKIDKKNFFTVSLISALFLGYFYFQGKLPMNWPTRDFDHLSIILLSTISMSYLLYCLSAFLDEIPLIKNVFTFIGKRTYSILILHFLAFRIIFLGLYYINVLDIQSLSELTPRYYEGPQWLFFSIGAIIICLLLSKLSEKSRITNYLINARFGGK